MDIELTTLILFFCSFCVLPFVFMYGVYFFGTKLIKNNVKKYNLISSTKQKIPQEELIHKLINLNSEDMPFEVINGDVIKIKWKFADTKWYEWFGIAKFKAGYELHIFLTDRGVARVIEVTYDISNKFGASSNISISYHRGWSFFQKELKKVYALSEIFPPKVSKVVDYSYNSRSFRDPILTLIAESGWEIRPVSSSLRLGI